ncbi:MAG: hypothetical protein QOG22_2637 [Pseudonocardiales bacterium]|nr:hypothetical protein [Pseudonocardiales bacterium]
MTRSTSSGGMPAPESSTRITASAPSTSALIEIESAVVVNFVEFSIRQSTAASKRSASPRTVPALPDQLQSRATVTAQRLAIESIRASRSTGCSVGKSAARTNVIRFVASAEALSISTSIRSASLRVASSAVLSRMNSAKPRAIVRRVRSSCEPNRVATSRFSDRSRSLSRNSARRCCAVWWRLTCHTSTAAMTPIKTISEHSSQPMMPARACRSRGMAVTIVIAENTDQVIVRDHTARP